MEGRSDPAALAALAARQWRDYRNRRPGTWFAEERPPLGREDAYRVQMEVARLRCAAGDAVAGYKVGCIGTGVVEQFGMSGPIHARLFASDLYASGDTLDHAAFANLAIEGEMAVRIGPDGAIESMFPVVELHHYVFRGSPKTLVELIANNGINAGAVLPPGRAGAPAGHWEGARELAVAVNGKTIDSGPLWAMKGGAAEAVAWLREDLGRYGVGLAAGDLVLTGTPLGLHPVGPGNHVSVSVDGREFASCRIG